MQYTISEGIARNTTIATVQATDVDLYPNNQIVFRVINDPSKMDGWMDTGLTDVRYMNKKTYIMCFFIVTLFKIDHETGLLQTEGGPNDFDREAFTNYTITIWVRELCLFVKISLFLLRYTIQVLKTRMTLPI